MQINLAFFVSFLVLALRGTIFLALRGTISLAIGTIFRETNRRSTALHGFPESLHNSYTTGISCRAMDERRICGVSYPPSLADAKEETPNGRRRGTNVPRRERRGRKGKDVVSLSDAEDEEDKRGRDVTSSSDAEDEECQR